MLDDDDSIDVIPFPTGSPKERELSTRIKRLLHLENILTVGDVRRTSDERLLIFPGMGKVGVAKLREYVPYTHSQRVREDAILAEAERIRKRRARERRGGR